MERVWNFAAGPAMMPEEVLTRAASEMLSYDGSGMSVMEMSHRSKRYQAVYDRTEALLRELMDIPDDYAVLMMQGGATGQFAAVALNLLHTSADYVDSGHFARSAMNEAAKYGAVRCAASTRETNYTAVPACPPGTFDPRADYVHITTNNTIFGTAWRALPDTGGVPLVADMSSNILSEPVDVRRFGAFYAGAQKNIGPAGLTIVVVRRDLLGRARETTPRVLNWTVMAEHGSMPNTPPTFAIYMAGLCLEWLRDRGGVAGALERNREKADILYRALDESDLFHGTAEKESRSMMNVTFTSGDPETDAAFLKEAERRGLVSLKGHRLVGGIRASIYNAMPVEGVRALAGAMRDFELSRARGL